MTLNEKQFSELKTKAEKNGWKTSTTDYGDGCISYGFNKEKKDGWSNYLFATSQEKGRYEIFDYYYAELTTGYNEE